MLARHVCTLVRAPNSSSNLALGVGFEPTSPRFRHGAFTRLAFRAECRVESRAGVEPAFTVLRTGRSPLSAPRRDGAGDGNRTRIAGVALRGWTFQLHPHGGKRRESNLLPQRDCVYSAATAPAVLMGASRNWRRAEGSNLGPRGPLGFRDRLPATPAALSVLVHLPGFEPGTNPL